MRKVLLPVMIVVLCAVLAFLTKPTPEDFQEELQDRAAVVAGREDMSRAGWLPKGGNSLDEVVRVMSPEQAARQAHYSDYGLVSVFTIEYPRPNGTYKRVHATGLYGTFVVMSHEFER